MARSLKNKVRVAIDAVSATGDTTVTGNMVVDGLYIDPTEISYLDGLTSSVQTQLDSKANQATTYTKTETDSALNAKAPLANPVFTGTQKFVAVRETPVAIAASAIDVALGTLFTKTISGATTFTLSNVPATGTVCSFTLELTNGGSAIVTWWSGIKWTGGTAPTLTSAGVDILGFYTRDGGTTWRGMVASKDSK